MKHPISILPYEMNSVLEAGTDLNDYRTAGIFFFSYANRPTNLPPDGYGNGWCLVLPSSINSENYCTQIWISFGNNATTDARNKPMARRTYFNGTWTDWWKLPCTGEYTSSTDVTNAITTALADYIPHNTTEITATTEAEFEQMMGALPQTPPKTYFFHVLQGTSTKIGLPTGRYGIQAYTMGSTLRSVIAYSYNNDQKTYKKIRTAGTTGTWSSWIDITNTDTVTNLGTTVSNLGTQVGTNTTDISNLQTQVATNTSDIATLQTSVGNNTSDIATLQTQVGTNTTDIATLDHNRSMSKIYTITPNDLEFSYFVLMVSSQVNVTEINFCTCNGLVHMEVTGTTTEDFNIGSPIKVLTFRQPISPDTQLRTLFPKNTLYNGIAEFPANYVNPKSIGFIRNDALYFINESNLQQPAGTAFKVSVDYFCDTAINLSNIENNYGS